MIIPNDDDDDDPNRPPWRWQMGSLLSSTEHFPPAAELGRLVPQVEPLGVCFLNTFLLHDEIMILRKYDYVVIVSNIDTMALMIIITKMADEGSLCKWGECSLRVLWNCSLRVLSRESEGVSVTFFNCCWGLPSFTHLRHHGHWPLVRCSGIWKWLWFGCLHLPHGTESNFKGRRGHSFSLDVLLTFCTWPACAVDVIIRKEENWRRIHKITILV